MVWRQVNAIAVVIQPVQVPEAMSKAGLNSEVMANRISDRLKEIDQSAQSLKPRGSIERPGADLDIQIPGSAVSSRALGKF